MSAPGSLPAQIVDQITAAIDASRDELIGLLQELVRIPSTNPKLSDEAPNGEAAVQDRVGVAMEAAGAEFDRWDALPSRPNLVGTILFALVLGRTELFGPEFHRAFEHLAREAIRADFGLTMLRAVFAGWLIALMVWMLPASQSAHVLVIVVMTWLVGAGGLPHIVAGSTEVAYLATVGSIGWDEYLVRFVAPTLIGNTVGGTMLVAALNHAQVAG